MKAFHCVLICVAVGVLSSASAEEKPNVKTEPAKVQLAILLDTSGSMDGLINQARTQLWKIVNELATAKRGDETPNLEVALFEYGKNSIPQSQGYLRQIVGLSDDLDKLSEELFALKTNGGKEYCGQVIAAATNQLKWSTNDESLKLIFICGNEAFTQGDVDYKKACSSAIAKGITVSTVFCGPRALGEQSGWLDGARLADGSFLSINQDQQVAAVKTPYDAELSKLSGAVNRTYLFGGQGAAAARGKQLKADRSAAKAAPAAAAERAGFKASGKYKSKGDLVDGIKSGKLDLKKLTDEQLPVSLQKKSLAEKKQLIEKYSTERVRIQESIRQLSEKRKAFIAKERAKQAKTTKDDTLDTAVIKALREQAKRKKYAIGG